MTAQEPTPVPRQAYDLLKSILLGLVILAAGVAIGAGLTYMALSSQKDRYGQEPELFAEHMLRQLGRELNLTPQQRRRLDPILQNHFKTLNDIRAGVRPQIVSQLEQLNSDIASVLDIEQTQLWQSKVQRLEDHFPTFRRRGPGQGQGFGPEGGRGSGQGFGPEGGRGRGPDMEPEFTPQPGQEFGPGPRGPQGPRQPFGPGFRRQERLGPPDPNEPRPQPRPEPPSAMTL
jgi:TolA-binding protein